MGGPRLLVNYIRPIRINELDSCYFSCWPSACHWVLAKHNSSQTWIMFLAESFLTVGHDNSAPLLVQDFLRFHSARTTEQQKLLQHDWSVELARNARNCLLMEPFAINTPTSKMRTVTFSLIKWNNNIGLHKNRMIKVRKCHYLAVICNRQRGRDSELIRRKINQRLIFSSLVSDTDLPDACRTLQLASDSFIRHNCCFSCDKDKQGGSSEMKDILERSSSVVVSSMETYFQRYFSFSKRSRLVWHKLQAWDVGCL